MLKVLAEIHARHLRSEDDGKERRNRRENTADLREATRAS